MANAFFNVPKPVNEPVKAYAPGSPERKSIKKTLRDLKSKTIDIPMVIGGKDIFTDNKISMHPPHERKHLLGTYSKGTANHVQQAIDAAMEAKPQWEALPWEEKAAIFLKAADLLAGPYRDLLNGSTMLGQSKNIMQAEIDAACELIDFFKFNVQYMTDLYKEQPDSNPGMWNRLEYRPLEGFVFAVTPFNFTSICGNLCAAPAMMGNTIVWKPSSTQIYSAYYLMKLFKEAGLPDGVINMVMTDGKVAGEECFSHPDFAGIHFTGGTRTFQFMWKTIGDNISKYKTYPRIVGETGGKDFIVAHASSIPAQVSTALSRGSFEYQGQKCSAASRAYIPSNIWDEVKTALIKDVKSFKMGKVDDFGNFINAVIDENSFDNIAKYLDAAKTDKNAEIIVGGGYDKTEGFFIEPTVIVTSDPKYTTMCDELFGPVMTIFVYEPEDWIKTLHLVDTTSPYALTGAVFSQDRYALEEANTILKHAAGNFYINDKPTGAVVGQQPFGGARASGTNDKAGSKHNLLRWVSMRTIKETFVPATDYRYPFLEE
ncbi:MAG: L-glutamate gamma-semialdehyde dehydrogenase [Chitinophagales bacterium]|nr:L-glutamate gamma-semialdehyde dehydrogenase [Chitinophagales bacterium]